jgi:hypothetical protein
VNEHTSARPEPSLQDTVTELACLLRQRGRGEPLTPPPGGALDAYAALLSDLGPDTDVPGALRGHPLRPFFLVNGLILASGHEEEGLAFTLEALATGLSTFTAYVAAISDPPYEIPAPEVAVLLAEQKRLFAFLLAQLPECGMGLDGILASMKGDAFDQAAAYELRAVLEEGPEALYRGALFTAVEKGLWRAVFEGAPLAFETFQRHLVAAYEVPLRRAPPQPAQA